MSMPGPGLGAPRIAVCGTTRLLDGVERATVNAAYVRAVADAGGVPLIVSPLLGAGHAAEVLDGVAGLLLTGGEDVDPELYGAEPSPHLGTVDRGRDLLEVALVTEAGRRGMPVLGICRGIQLVNVAFGGTLWQDLPSERPGPVSHDPHGPRDAAAHRVRIAPDSRAARATGAAELVPNSLHHQAVRELAPGLVATAWADDGLVEAVESAADAPWLLAVQWHPEEMQQRQASARGLFASLQEEARRFAADVNAGPAPAARGRASRSRGTAPDRSSR